MYEQSDGDDTCFLNEGSSYAGGQWAAGDEPLYYIVSPKDVVIAKPRLVSSITVLPLNLVLNMINRADILQ